MKIISWASFYGSSSVAGIIPEMQDYKEMINVRLLFSIVFVLFTGESTAPLRGLNDIQGRNNTRNFGW